jgi:hypothetical protein
MKPDHKAGARPAVDSLSPGKSELTLILSGVFGALRKPTTETKTARGEAKA